MRSLSYIRAWLMLMVLCLLLASCGGPDQEDDDEIASPVSVTEIKSESIEQHLVATGTVRAMQEAVLPALARGLYVLQENPDTGRPFVLGDRIKMGQPLVKLVNPEQMNTLRLEAKQLALDAARMEYEKQKSLHAKGGVTQRELTDAKRRYIDARYDFDAAQIKLAKLQVAPTFTGTIVELPYKTDNTPIEAGTAVAKVMDFGTLYLEVNLPGKDLGTVLPGQAVKVSNYARPDDVLEGQINQVAPALDAQSRSFKAAVTIPNQALSLRPGMFVKAEIVTDQKDSTIVIPKDIIVARDYGKIVYVVEKGAAREKVITTGLESEDRIEVIDGLEIDQRLVIEGFETLRNNSKVKIVR